MVDIKEASLGLQIWSENIQLCRGVELRQVLVQHLTNIPTFSLFFLNTQKVNWQYSFNKVIIRCGQTRINVWVGISYSNVGWTWGSTLIKDEPGSEEPLNIHCFCVLCDNSCVIWIGFRTWIGILIYTPENIKKNESKLFCNPSNPVKVKFWKIATRVMNIIMLPLSWNKYHKCNYLTIVFSSTLSIK